MGAAKSTNVADIVASVTDNFIHSVSQSQEQISKQFTDIKIHEVYVAGDLDISLVKRNLGKAASLAATFNQQDAQNEIQQELIQKAIAEVGALGIGFTDANNIVQSIAKLSTSMVNQIQNVSLQSALFMDDIDIHDVYVGVNLNLST